MAIFILQITNEKRKGDSHNENQNKRHCVSPARTYRYQ